MSMQVTMMSIKGTSGAIAMSACQGGAVGSMAAGGSAACPGPLKFFIVGVVFSAQTGI